MHILHDQFTDRTAGWSLLTEFIERYLRPLTSDDAVDLHEISVIASRLGCELPKAMTEFYRLCGNAKDIWCRQDHLLLPSQMRQEDSMLVFCEENQGVWRIGIRMSDLEQDDPPVVWDGDPNTPREIAVLIDRFSRFAVNMIAYVTKFFQGREIRNGYPHQIIEGYCEDIADLVKALASVYSRCNLEEYWVCWPCSYYQDIETFVEVDELDGIIYPNVKTPAALERFVSAVRDSRFEWVTKPLISSPKDEGL